MAGSRSGLEDLELTGEEVARLRRAFQDEEFRRLFAEYAAELSDPAQRATYEAEVVALERQRGVEARFLHPAPGWVLRTSQAGARRCYVNVCGNALVGRPEARPEPGGARWTLPHCLSAARQELPRRRPVYDVLFHPDALRLAASSPRFRRLLDQTALDAVEGHFSPGLDRANAAPLRGKKYKGLPQASLLRTPLPPGQGRGGDGGGDDGGDDGGGDSPLPPFPTPYRYPPPPPPAQDPQPEPRPAPPAATTPRWALRQRSFVDLQDYRCSRDSAPSPVPRELEVTVELPLLSSAAQARLEVRGRELRLDSSRPAAAYSLRLRLPYPVDEEGGTATFDKSQRRLVVTLPVRRTQPAASPAGPGEEEPPGTGGSPPCLQPPEGSPYAVQADHRPTLHEEPSPATHVGAKHVELPVCANHVKLPVCADESGPALACSDSLDVRLGSAPELPVDPETVNLFASDDASCSLEAPAFDGSSGLGALEGAACARDDQCQHAPTCLPLAHEVCGVGDSRDLPETPGTAGLAVGLSVDVDLEQRPEVASAAPSSELEDAAAPSAHLCGVSADWPVTMECQSGSKPDQSVGACAHEDGSGDPSSPASPACSPSTHLSVTALNATDNPPGSPPFSRTGLGDVAEPALSPSSSAGPPPLCPPFQCTQDEEALMLLLQVPGIVPQSLKGEVGTHHYRVSFASKDSISYVLLLQLPAGNKLTSPEAGVSVSSDNAVVHLTKAPDAAGLWMKLYFGLSEDGMQEKLFVTEDNVAGFLDSLPRPSCPSQPKVEEQPLIEVLEVSEGQSRIRLKTQEPDSPEEKVDPGIEEGEDPSGAEIRPLAAADPGGERTERASDSLSAAETKEPAGWGGRHCVELDPGLASLGKSQITKLQESELPSAADSRAAATEQTQLEGGKPAGTGGEHRPGSRESGRLPAPVLRETDMRDGSVQFISHHATHCAVTFQNPLLYELD